MTHSTITHSIFSSTIKYPSNQRGKLQNLMSSVSSFHTTNKHTHSSKQNNKRSTMFQIPNNRPIITMFLFLIFIINIIIVTSSSSDLRPGFYSKTCPKAETIVRDVMRKALIREPRSVASVMRLQFHDCFVNGCDGSVLLDDTPTMLGEKLALSNINSLRSFEVVDEVKEALEKACPGVVSCADIIIMASRDAVALTGGPDWEVRLGRLDSLTASQEDSDNIMPSPRANASTLIDLFQRFNLTVKDLVALSGSHSIGQGRCFSIMFRLYNQSGSGKPDPALDPAFRLELDKLCPLDVDQNKTGNLDSTPVIFDNQYFKDLVGGRGFLNSDQTLFTYPQTKGLVRFYSRDQSEFFKAFVKGMLKMGDLQSGRPGEVRRNCRVVNDRFAYVLFQHKMQKNVKSI